MNEIHPTAIVGPDVQIGDGNYIGAFAYVTGRTTIGDGNWVGPHVVIGTPAEHREQDPKDLSGKTNIGSFNIIRERCTIQAGFNGTTIIGNRIAMFDMTHIGHNCLLYDDITIAGSVALAGHTCVHEYANIGLSASVHQRSVIGAGAMVGMGAVVQRNVPPFATVIGNPARVISVNRVGLERRGWSSEIIELVAEVHAGKRSPEELPTELSTFFSRFSRPWEG